MVILIIPLKDEPIGTRHPKRRGLGRVRIPLHPSPAITLAQSNNAKEKENKNMAMITRTVLGTSITAKVVNKNTNDITDFTTVVSKVVTDEKGATKELAKVIPAELVIIDIKSFEKVEKLYGITVADFMANAKELDPKTRKPLTTAPVEA